MKSLQLFHSGPLFEINCWICTPVATLLTEQHPNAFLFSSSETSLSQPCWRNELPALVIDGLLNLLLGTSVLLLDVSVKLYSNSRSMNQQPTESSSISFARTGTTESGAEETRYDHYWGKVNHCGKSPSHCLNPEDWGSGHKSHFVFYDLNVSYVATSLHILWQHGHLLQNWAFWGGMLLCTALASLVPLRVSNIQSYTASVWL